MSVMRLCALFGVTRAGYYAWRQRPAGPRDGERFRDVRELRCHLHRYVRYYNYRRMHSALQYQAPVDYERGAA